jgi:hypothetical protein
MPTQRKYTQDGPQNVKKSFKSYGASKYSVLAWS